MVVNVGLHLLRHRLILARIRARLDLLLGQPDGHDQIVARTHHRQNALYRKGEVQRSDRRGVDQYLATGQPMSSVNHHPADLPTPVVEQEVLDGADVVVARVDGASEQTANGKQHWCGRS
jgi:hypothetical protein